MSTTATDGVHRLVDMVVEEVSLVDRAANLRRFLIVKRDDTMDDTKDTTKADVPDDSPLGMALAALESLTDIVELLGDSDAADGDPRVTALAEQLRTTAEQLLSQAGLAEAEEDDDTEKAKSVADNVAATKTAVARLRRAKKPSPKPPAKKPDEETTEGDDKKTEKVDLSPLTDGLAKLTESFKALTESVTAQAQRLGRVEKQFGMPNSIAAPPPPPPTKEDAVAWPLDLNKPLDRDSVDKSLSFHEP